MASNEANNGETSNDLKRSHGEEMSLNVSKKIKVIDESQEENGIEDQDDLWQPFNDSLKQITSMLVVGDPPQKSEIQELFKTIYSKLQVMKRWAEKFKQSQEIKSLRNNIQTLNENLNEATANVNCYETLIMSMRKTKENCNRDELAWINFLSNDLLAVSEIGHLNYVKFLLNLGADVTSSLFGAFRKGHIIVVDELLKYGADINDTENGFTLLYDAANKNDLNTIKELIRLKANTNCKSKNNETPLHCSVRHGHLEITVELLNNGADPNIKDASGFTPLHRATEKGRLQIVKALIKHGANINFKSKNNSPLHLATERGHLDIIQELMYHDADVNCKNENYATPLHFSAYNGHLEIVKELLKHGPDINAKNKGNKTPLHHAIVNKHLLVVSELISNGADIHCKIDSYWPSCSTHMSPLHLAARCGHLEIVKELLKQGVDINCKDENNETPLHSALRGNFDSTICTPDIKIVNELLLNGADVNVRSSGKSGKTALDLALQFSLTQVATAIRKYTSTTKSAK